MGLLDMFNSDYNAGYQLGKQLRSNPQLAKQYYDNKRLQQEQQYLENVLGHKVDLGQEVSNTPTQYGQMDLNVGGVDVPKMEGFTPGSGLLGGKMSQPELGMKLLAAPGQVAQQTGSNILQQMYKPQDNAGLNIVGSPLKLKNGNFGYLDGITGKVVDTGNKYYEAPKTVSFMGVPYLYNSRQAPTPINTNGNIATPEMVTNIETERAKQKEGAIQGVKSEFKAQEDANNAAKLAEGALGYVDNAIKLASNMNDYQLGPIAGNMPSVTKNGQLLDMQLNSLIGNVRDKLGPGLLSDTDIKLLKKMIPNTLMDKEPLLEALDMFKEELQRIISQKTGYTPENKPENKQKTTVKWSDL